MSENIIPSQKEVQKGSDLTTEQGVVDYMSASTSEENWNSRCDEVKAANGGDYPGFWYVTIMLSGLASKVFAKW